MQYFLFLRLYLSTKIAVRQFRNNIRKHKMLHVKDFLHRKSSVDCHWKSDVVSYRQQLKLIHSFIHSFLLLQQMSKRIRRSELTV